MTDHLRPVERRVLAMKEEGLSTEEIAGRIKRSPEHVERILEWSEIPRSRLPAQSSAEALERRVLALRHEGEGHEEIGRRFGKSGRFIRQVEGLAHYRRALELLS